MEGEQSMTFEPVLSVPTVMDRQRMQSRLTKGVAVVDASSAVDRGGIAQ